MYEGIGHFKFRCRYHIIFVCKFRYKVLQNTQIDTKVKQAIEAACRNQDFKVELMESDKNHLHLLLSCKPTIAVSKAVSRLKQYTTYYVYKDCYNAIRQYYRPPLRILWTKGCFVSTIGTVSEENIKRYIKEQG